MPKFVSAPSRQQELVDPRLLHGVRNAFITGLALVLLLPVARGHSDWLGWMPLWLVGMPAVAWWSLHRFRLPLRKAAAQESSKRARRRRPGTQARRRVAPGLRRLPRVA
jgi:predicted MFS family arabinose efflux permease